MEFSRIGRHGTELQTVDCKAIIEKVTRNLQAAIQESGAVICYDDLPTLLADESQLLQVFQNLIGNAIKFRGADPPVIRVRASRVAQEWEFTVSDNGIGISPENAETIFVIFKRLHTRAEYPGNGIGLSICKKIIEHHGGKIWVEPGRGQGSTFKFTLPFRERNGMQGQAHEENR